MKKNDRNNSDVFNAQEIGLKLNELKEELQKIKSYQI
jgi:hypothetical protein